MVVGRGGGPDLVKRVPGKADTSHLRDCGHLRGGTQQAVGSQGRGPEPRGGWETQVGKFLGVMGFPLVGHSEQEGGRG